MWRKGNPCTCSVGMRISIAVLENDAEIPQEIRSTTTTWFSNLIGVGVCPKDVRLACWRDIYPQHSPQPRDGSDLVSFNSGQLNEHTGDGCRTCGVYEQKTILTSHTSMMSCCLPQHGWTWRMLCYVIKKAPTEKQTHTRAGAKIIKCEQVHSQMVGAKGSAWTGWGGADQRTRNFSKIGEISSRELYIYCSD